MPEHSWTVRLYEVGDERDYIALMNSTFPRYRCDMKRWRWEFEENPFGFLQAFGSSDGKLVGHMGLVGIPIKVNGTTVRGSEAVDLAVRPEFRGRGMFIAIGKKLIQEAENKGLILSYAVIARPRMHDWPLALEIPVLVKMISKKAYVLFELARLLDLLHQPHLRTISNILCLNRDLVKATIAKRSLPLRASNFTKRVITRFDSAFKRLWEECSDQHQLLVVRNEAYLNWRYFKRPYSDYTVIVAERSNTVEGYIVLSTKIHGFAGWKKGYVVDILGKSEESVHFLIQLACSLFAEENADLVVCWMMKNQPYYRCLTEHGFVNDISSSQKLFCRVNTNDSAFRRLYRQVATNWFFTMGDSDYV